MRIRLALMTLLAVTGLAAGIAKAQPMAEAVPDNALMYAGWAGNKSLEVRAKGTHLESVLKATNMTQRVKDAFKKVSDVVAVKDPDAVEMFEVLNVLGEATWQYPSAFYVLPGAGNVQMGPNDPPLGFVWRWRADGEAAALTAKVQTIIDKVEGQRGVNPSAPKVAQAGPYVVVYAGQVDAAAVLREKPAAALKESARFKKTFAVVGKPASSEMAFYMDAKGALGLINKGVSDNQQAEFNANWTKVRDALSLEGVNAVVWSGGFEGKEWMTRTFIDAPSPRKGMVSLMEVPALSQETLKMAPRGTVWIAAYNFDLSQLVKKVQEIATAVEPQAQQGADQALEGVKQNTGVDVKLFLSSLGPEWIAYSDPGLGGSGVSSMIMVNRLRDAKAFKTQLAAVQAIANRMAEGSRDGFKFRIDTVKQGELEIHTVNVMMAAPSWTIRGDRFYLGLSPQTLEAAAMDERKDGSILDNPQYAAVMKKLGGKDLTSVGFVDLPKTASETYQGLTSGVQFLGGLLQQSGVSNPLPGLIPPLPTITANLAPAGSAGWADASGFHYASIAPFPGAKMFGPDVQVSVAPSAMAIGMMLPALGAARRTANQMKSNSQLRGIHQCMVIYATEKGAYPSNMGVLLDEKYVAKDLLASPMQALKYPDGFDKLSTAEKGKWLEENGSYVMLRWGQKESKESQSPDTVVGYLKPAHFPGNGISVVFGDNHALWMPIEEARQLIVTQYPNHKLQGFPENRLRSIE